MFSGIVETTAPVAAVKQQEKNLQLVIAVPDNWELQPGQSIAINGVCLTVTTCSETQFTVELMSETLCKTIFSSIAEGSLVNLERSMVAGKTIDGHFVTGHIDYIGEIIDIQSKPGQVDIEISIKPGFESLIAKKGSIALHGISLTVVDVTHNSFTVSIIPYTIEHTILRFIKVHDKVHVECDILAKYIQRTIQ